MKEKHKIRDPIIPICKDIKTEDTYKIQESVSEEEGENRDWDWGIGGTSNLSRMLYFLVRLENQYNKM